MVSFSCNDAHAQFTCGVRAGLNLSFKTGLLIGAVADYSLSNKITVESDILFSQQGVSSLQIPINPPIYYKESLNFIRIPLNLRLVFGKRLLLHTGPYLGFAVSSTGKCESTNRETRKKEVSYYDISQKYKSFNWGINVGAAMKFGNFQVGLERTKGLIQNRESSGKQFNYAWALTATYMFGKTKENRNEQPN